MTIIYLAVFRRFTLRRLSLLAIIPMVVVMVASSLSVAEAYTWAGKIQIGNNGSTGGSATTVMFDPTLRARPTDGLGYMAGDQGYDNAKLPVSTTSSPNVVNDINDATLNGAKRVHIGFAQDGSGYFVWRQHPTGYQGWLRRINPDGSFSPGVDLGALYQQAGSLKQLDQPDVAVSPLTGRVYVVGSVVTGPQHMGFAEYNPATQTLSGVVDNFPSSTGSEIQPRICIDTSRGRDDIHLVGKFESNIYAFSRINGVWQPPSPALTDASAAGFGFIAKISIACDSGNGYAYAAFDSINADNTGLSTGLVKYTPNANPDLGGSWAQINRNPGHAFGGYDIYGPTYSNTWNIDVCGSLKGVVGSGVTVTPDHEVWVTSGVNCGPYAGLVVATLSNTGTTLDTFERAMPDSPTSQAALIDYAPAAGRMYIASTFQSPAPNISYFSYATIVGPPTNFTATAVNYKRIDLSWTYPNPGNFTNVQLERSPDNVNWTVIANLPITQFSYSDSNLASPNTTYYYRIKGYNTTNSSSYVTASATTLPVPAPANFSATPISYKQIDLHWTYPSPGDITSVQLERSTDNATWNIIATGLPTSQTGYADNNLPVPGITYYYRIKGYSATLTSAYVTASAATFGPAYLTFDSPPGQIEPAPTVFGNLPKITVRDVFLNVITTYSGSVTLSVTSGPSGYTFGGTKTVAVTNGVADFTGTGLTLDKIGNYVIQASAPGIPSGTLTSNITVTVRAKLAFSSGTIGNQIANGAFSVTVQVQRPSDNSLVNNYNGTVTLAIRPGTGAAGAKINGVDSITGNVVNGQVTFPSVAISSYGPAYQLAVSSADPISTGFSNSFNVQANFSFTTVPSPVTVNSSFTVVATVKGAGNNALISYNGPVLLSVSSGPGSLLGISTVNAVAGVANFNNLAFNTSGTYVLQATLPLGDTTTSSNITVNAATSCQSLVVNTTSLTGDDAGTNCTTITLPGALGRATSGDVIRFASNILGGTINLGSGDQSLPAGVSLQGGCDSNGPRIIITVGGNRSNFQVGPNSSIWGIKLTNLKLSLPGTAKGNQFSCFVTAP